MEQRKTRAGRRFNLLKDVRKDLLRSRIRVDLCMLHVCYYDLLDTKIIINDTYKYMTGFVIIIR